MNGFLDRILHQPGDNSEILVLKKIWILLAGICIIYPATEAFLLALNGIYEHLFWRLSLSIACLIQVVVFFTNKGIKLEVSWFLLCLTVLTITSVIQYLTGGLLHSAGISFIAFASTIVALVQPKTRYAHFLFMLYLIFMIGGTILQPYMAIDDQTYTISYKARYIAKFLCGTFAIYLTFLYFIIQVKKIREAKEKKLKELDQAKTKFYTNMTHEFRTPLTMILGWAERILDDPDQYINQGISSIQNNGNKLLDLVNQLMDISKLEAGSMELKSINADIIPIVKNVVEGHKGLAGIREIRLDFTPGIEELYMDFDVGKIEAAVSNILSNALKFTPKNGAIDISTFKRDGVFVIKVKDNGPGIAQKHLPHIFDRFYQVDNDASRTKGGSGIGLAIAKGLVELMSGVIEVESGEGQGSTFSIKLPIQCHAPMAMGNQVQILTNLKQIDVEPRVSNGNSEDPLILIVEDHEEMCQFIESILVEDYRTITAANGTEGIETAFKAIPDLIITDIMMPGIDGIELNKALKRDIRTSHIPVIMLTAKNDIESKLQGLESGAEAYLTKPFSKKELLLRLHNIFELRKKLHLHYWAMFNGSDQQLDHLPFSDFENDFLNKIKQIIEDQIDDPQFDVEKLAKKALLSYSQLYRKLKSLTGHTPIQYIHEIRLKRAKEMLTSSDLPISEIAFQVGIEDPVYFTRIFKKKFGETPSHLRSLVKS